MSELEKMIGESDALRVVKSLILQAAPTDISVLIIGESGTGKELVARAIHEHSSRRHGPLLFVNCGAIPQGIFESEVFGHERGSFTGADKKRIGYFEQAEGGTLVLDEIGEMPMESQVKLLRILESREVMRVGSSKPLPMNVRVLAATNSDLIESVAKGEFRHDLYFRLKAVTIQIPPLRERSDDVPLLAIQFAREFADRNKMVTPRFTSDALEMLSNQYWPGNVRELKNTIETVLTLNRGVAMLHSEHFRPHLLTPHAQLPMIVSREPHQPIGNDLLLATLLDLRREVRDLREMLMTAIESSQVITEEPLPSSRLTDLERGQIQRMLEMNQGNRRKTARDLGIGERTLYRKLKEYNLG